MNLPKRTKQRIVVLFKGTNTIVSIGAQKFSPKTTVQAMSRSEQNKKNIIKFSNTEPKAKYSLIHINIIL